MFISKSKAQSISESLSPMFANYYGRAADVEHQRRQRQHLYVVYVTLHGQHARFAMPAMFGAASAEV